jgi:hypothetical protein
MKVLNFLAVAGLAASCSRTGFTGKTAQADAPRGGQSGEGSSEGSARTKPPLYVPLGGSKKQPGTGECRSDDPAIAACSNGLIVGRSEGTTTAHIGGEDVEVIVYDPKNPPYGTDGGIDGTHGGGSTDASDGADGGTGGTAGGDSSGGGPGIDAGDGSAPGGSDDAVTDGGEVSSGLTEDLTLSQLLEDHDDADCENETTITKLDKSGGRGQSMTVHFGEHEAKTVTLAGFCNKKADTLVAISVRMLHCGDDHQLTPADSKYVGRTGGSDQNNVEITFDDGSCLIGTCIDRGKDNTFRLECPSTKHELKVDGLN